MLWKCCTQYANKFGKLSSGPRIGKSQFSFQSQRSEVKWKSLSCVRFFVTPWTIQSRDSPGQKTGVGSHSLLQRIFPTKDWTQASYIAGRFFTSWGSREAPIPRKRNTKECSNYLTTALISHTREVMFKILEARLQWYVNRELPDVLAGFRKCTGNRDQIANIYWIIEKARKFQKNIYFCFIDYAKAFDFVNHNYG